MSKIKKFVSLLMLVLYVSYYVNTNFFIHTHTFPWGTITHSHPYSSATHTHSTNTLQLIYSLTTLLFISGATLYLILLSASRAFFFSVEIRRVTSLFICHNLLRGPPIAA